MPEDPLKKLLVRLKLDTTDFSKTIQNIKSQMKEINDSARKDAIAATAEAKKHNAVIQQEILDQRRLQAEARALFSFDQARAQWEKKNQEVLRTKIQQRALETAEVRKQQTIAQGALKLEQQQLQIQAQRLRLLQQQTAAQARANQTQAGGGGGGALGGILGGLGRFASGVAGGGMMGAMFAGSLGGGIVLELMEKMGEKIHELGEALMQASGPAQQLRMEFERLAQLKGVDPSEMLNKLRQATRGLVADIDLFKIANNFLKSGMNVTTDQVIKLTENTVNLGRSMGKTGQDVARALELAFLNPQRGMMILARTTGIQVQELRRSIAGIPQSVDPAVRATIMFNSIMEQEERMLRKVGVPITTLPELFTQVANAEKNFVQGVAEGLIKTGTFGNTINSISKYLIEIEPKLQSAAEWIGEKLGGAFVVAGEAGKVFIAEIRLLVTTASGLFRVFLDITKTVYGTGEEFKVGGKKVDAFRGTMGTLALVINQVGFAFNRSAIMMRLFFDMIADRGKSAEKLQDDVDRATESLRKLNKEHKASQKDIEDYMTGKKGPALAAAAEEKPDVQDSIAVRNKKLEQDKKIEEMRAKISLDLFKQGLIEKEAANKEDYDAGLISLKTYITKEEALKKIQLAATLGEIEEERRAQQKLNALKGTVTVGGQALQITDKQTQQKAALLIDEEARKKRIDAVSSTEKQINELRMQGVNDSIQAYKIREDEIAKIEREGVQDRLKILETEFKMGLVSADDYIAKRKDLIEQEYKATIAGIEIQRKAAKDNASETARLDVEALEAHRKAVAQGAELDAHRDEIRLQYIQSNYKLRTAPLETQVQIARGDTTGQSTAAEDAALQKLLAAARTHLKELQSETFNPMSDAWEKQQQDIEQTILKVQQLGIEIRKLHDPSGVMGGIFGGISGVAGAIPRSTGASQVSQLFGSMAQDAAKIGESKAASGGKPFDALAKSFEKLLKSTDPLSDRLKSFGTALTNVIGGVVGAVHGVTSGKSGGGGALSGAMSGMNLGSAAGPYGMIAGAVIGGVMGGIFGSKEKQLMQTMHKIQDQMQSIIDSMNSGAITLSQAIQDMRQERQAAIQMLAQDPKASKGGSKGGKGYTPSQGQAMIDQIDAQIAQLVNSQQQLLSQLDQQVAILSNPLPFQQYAQSLDSIIEKYQQFASAAGGNAQAVANAQLYLNESLQAYVTTLGQQLNQAQQNAIQDALTLLNLEYQRQQIINQEAQQEYDILTQGVLTRQRTTAMTKGQQIGQLRYERDMQLQQIDEQIALQQYKVQTEQQIFGLATTRIGLEMQLLSLQEQAAGTQNEQTAALLQVVQQLQTGLANGTLINQIGAMGPTATGTGILTTLLGSLGLGGNIPTGILTGVGGATNYLSQIPQAYQSIVNFMNNLDPNFLMNLWSAMQTPAGSGQRQSVIAEAAQYQQDATTSGYDYSGFIQWIQSGAPITGTTATVTNTPAPTGPAPLPGGTTFGMPTSPGTPPSTIPGYSGSGSTAPYDAVSSSMTDLSSSTLSASQAMSNFATVMQGISSGYTSTAVAAGGTLNSIANPVMGLGTGLQITSPSMSSPLYLYNTNKDLQFEETNTIPQFAQGGPVTQTGLAVVDEGEWVLPKPIVGVLNAMKMLSGTPATPGATSGTTDTASLAVHSSLLEMTSQRTAMEMTVISARNDQLTQEFAYLQALNDTITKMAQLQPAGLAGTFEGLLNKTYQTRGRYGSGGVRREYL